MAFNFSSSSQAGAQVHVVCPHCAATNRVLTNRPAGGAKCGQCKQALFTGHPVELTRATFDHHISANDLPVVVDFWAPWCAPCRLMAPAYDEAAKHLEPQVRLAKVNTEAEQEIAARFGIRGIPTLIAFRNGREVARQSGALDVSGIMSWVEAHS